MLRSRKRKEKRQKLFCIRLFPFMFSPGGSLHNPLISSTFCQYVVKMIKVSNVPPLCQNYWRPVQIQLLLLRAISLVGNRRSGVTLESRVSCFPLTHMLGLVVLEGSRRVDHRQLRTTHAELQRSRTKSTELKETHLSTLVRNLPHLGVVDGNARRSPLSR